jgi:hypothetical protein
VQSHVAFGYVGGKAAAFPLQCLGYDVDVRERAIAPSRNALTRCPADREHGQLLEPFRCVALCAGVERARADCDTDARRLWSGPLRRDAHDAR